MNLASLTCRYFWILNIGFSSLNETINQLAMANSVRWYGHVLRREDGRVLRRALDFQVECQRKKGMSKRLRRGRLEKGRCTLPIKVECWHKSDCYCAEVNLDTLT